METDEIRFSVVIPSYNRGHLVNRAIDSALAQSKLPAEIILVDDGSTDDTKRCIEGKSRFVKYVYQENAGASAARNRGVREASCEWIAFLDSDDYWFPDYLMAMANAIKATDRMGNLYFADTMLPKGRNGGSLWSIVAFNIDGEYMLFEDATRLIMTYLPLPMMLQSAVVSREAFLACGGFWQKLSSREDTHFFFRMGFVGNVCAVKTLGAQMTADDNPANRLTAVHRQKAPQGYRMQIVMYEDLLHVVPKQLPAIKKIFRRRIADAYLRLARNSGRNRDWKETGRFIALSIINSPRALLQSFKNKLSHSSGQNRHGDYF